MAITTLRERKLGLREGLSKKSNKLYFYCESANNFVKLVEGIKRLGLMEESGDVDIVPEDLGIGVGGELFKGNKDLQDMFHKWAKPYDDYDLMKAGNPATDKLESYRRWRESVKRKRQLTLKK